MIVIRRLEEIYKGSGRVENGTCTGRWHFSMDDYLDPGYLAFGTLMAFNDETLSGGAGWPLHRHCDLEIVTYCVEGEFRVGGNQGETWVLKKGGVLHTTVGKGIWHSEANNRKDAPARFVRMWFRASKRHLDPSVERKAVERAHRTNRFLKLVSPSHADALVIQSDAEVLACFLEKGKSVEHPIAQGRGVYLCVLEGGPVTVNGHHLPALSTGKLIDEPKLTAHAESDTELLLVDVLL